MEQEIQIIESYITKYEFKVQKRILSKEEFSIDLSLGYKILDQTKKDDEILVGLDLINNIILKENSSNNEIGKINISIYGLFKFESKISKSKIKKLIRINGVPNLYQQLRAYVSANTALSQSVPTINLPILDFLSKEII